MRKKKQLIQFYVLTLRPHTLFAFFHACYKDTCAGVPGPKQTFQLLLTILNTDVKQLSCCLSCFTHNQPNGQLNYTCTSGHNHDLRCRKDITLFSQIPDGFCYTGSQGKKSSHISKFHLEAIAEGKLQNSHHVLFIVSFLTTNTLHGTIPILYKFTRKQFLSHSKWYYHFYFLIFS